MDSNQLEIFLADLKKAFQFLSQFLRDPAGQASKIPSELHPLSCLVVYSAVFTAFGLLSSLLSYSWWSSTNEAFVIFQLLGLLLGIFIWPIFSALSFLFYFSALFTALIGFQKMRASSMKTLFSHLCFTSLPTAVLNPFGSWSIVFPIAGTGLTILLLLKSLPGARGWSQMNRKFVIFFHGGVILFYVFIGLSTFWLSRLF